MKLTDIIPVDKEYTVIIELVKPGQFIGLKNENFTVIGGLHDNTSGILIKLDTKNDVYTSLHLHNLDKVAAAHNGIQPASGKVLFLQDADFDYDPKEYLNLLNPIGKGKVDVVYGSCFLSRTRRPVIAAIAENQ